MKHSYLIMAIALSLLSACSSSPSLHPEQGIGAPNQGLDSVQLGIASPLQAIKVEETEKDDDEILPAQPEQKSPSGNSQ